MPILADGEAKNSHYEKCTDNLTPLLRACLAPLLGAFGVDGDLAIHDNGEDVKRELKNDEDAWGLAVDFPLNLSINYF